MAQTSQLYSEIVAQPDVLARRLSEGRPEVEAAAEKIRTFSPTWVLIAARGTSDNAARYAQYVLGARNRLGVALAVPSLHTLYEAPPDLSRALVIGISQSGQSPDVVSVLEEAQRQGGQTLALTNDTRSPLARMAESTIALGAGEEKAVAATKTYTSELFALAMLSAALERSERAWDELERVPDAVRAAIEGCPQLAETAERFRNASRFIVLGRGFNYCTAFEVALKMKETSYVLAEPYSPADLLHGPIALVDEGFPVMLMAPSGKANAGLGELLQKLNERRARVIAFSDDEALLDRVELANKLPAGVPEWLSPIVAVVPGQIWAQKLALAKWLDPDKPRGLSKVTLTR